MKMVHRYLERGLDFTEGRATVLVIENAKLFTELALELQNQCRGKEGRFVLSDGDEIIEVQKNADILTDMLNIDVNGRSIVSKLLTQLRETVNNDEFYIRTKETESFLIAFVSELANNIELPVVFDDSLDINGLMKLFNVRFSEDYDINIAEKLLVYMRSAVRLLNKKIFIAVNLKTFINDDDIRLLYKNLAYEKIPVLLLESTVRRPIEEYEDVTVIDNDMCEVV